MALSIYIARKIKSFNLDKAEDRYGGLVSIKKNKGTIVSISFGVSIASDISISFRKESWLTRFFKSLGFCNEFCTGDPEFDNKVFIYSGDRQNVKKLVEHKVLRDLIVSILYNTRRSEVIVRNDEFVEPNKHIVTSLNIREGAIWVTLTGKHLKNFDSMDGANLARLLDQFEPYLKGEISPETETNYLNYKSFLGYQVGLAIACFSFIFFMIGDGAKMISYENMWLYGITSAILVASVFLYMVYAYCRRSPFLHLILRDFILYGFICTFVASIFLMREFNIGLDTAVPETKSVQVLQKYRHHGSKSNTYHVTIADWRNPGASLSYQVGYRYYNTVNEGDEIKINIHAGALGDPWLEFVPRYSY